MMIVTFTNFIIHTNKKKHGTEKEKKSNKGHFGFSYSKACVFDKKRKRK